MALDDRRVPRGATIYLVAVVGHISIFGLLRLISKPFILRISELVEFEQAVGRLLDQRTCHLQGRRERVLDKGLLRQPLRGVRQHVRVGAEVVGLWVLHRVRAEGGDPWRVTVDPLVPTDAPSVVVDEDLIGSEVDDLCLKPLVYRVADIDPHPDLELSVRRFVLLDVPVILWTIPRLLPLPVDETSVLRLDHSQVLVLFALLIRQLVVKQELEILHGAPEHVKGFCLVEPDLLKIVSSVLLEDEPTISTKNVRLVEGSHDLLHQVQVADALNVHVWVGTVCWSASWPTRRRLLVALT